MLNRPIKFLWIDESLNEQITLAPGETKEARFKTWLAEKITTTRFCRNHPQTRLVVCRASRKIMQVYEDRTNHVCYNPFQDPVIIPGVFNFKVEFHCPSCRCASAFCPPEFHNTPLDTFDTSTPERAKALAAIRDFVKQVNQHGCGWALIVGPPGTGKTRLASGAVRELDDHDALYVRQGELTCALRANYGRKDVFLHQHHESNDDDGGNDESPTPLDIVQRVRFLVLDEIGCNSLANDDRLLFDELLKHRYDHRKPTILISNLPLTGTRNEPGLKEFLGDVLTDRIRHASGGGKFILQFKGESYRRAVGESYLEGLA